MFIIFRMYLTDKINLLSQQFQHTLKGWHVDERKHLFTFKVLFYRVHMPRHRGVIAKLWPNFSSRKSRQCVVCMSHDIRECCMRDKLLTAACVSMIFSLRKEKAAKGKTLLINRLQHSITNYCQLSSSIAVVFCVTFYKKIKNTKKGIAVLSLEWLN